MRWENKTVLVTGAGGFIGSHVTERLVELGARVKAFVRYNSRNDWGLLELLPERKLAEIEVFTADLRDAEAVRRAVENAHMIFHLGSLIAIPYSYLYPGTTIETNVIGAVNIMSAAREAGVERVLHTSTSEVYGTARYTPMDENHPLQGQSPYSASKIGADMVAESFRCSFELPVVIIRPFNTFGPRQSARAAIPTIISQALSPASRIVLGSIHPRRDYTYIDDTVDAFIRAADAPDIIGETINIGSGVDSSIGEIAEKILSIMGVNKQISQSDERIRPANSEVQRLCCDSKKAKELLGWEPRTGFDEGLKSTIKWIAGHPDLYKAGIYNI